MKTLEPDKAVEGQLRGGEVDTYRLSLEHSEFLHIVADQRGVDVVLTLFGPDSKRIKRADSSNGAFGPESLSVIAKRTGDYRLEITSYLGGGAGGRYVVRSTIHKVPTAQDKQRIVAEDEYFAGMQLQEMDTAEARRGAVVEFKKAAAMWRLLGDSYEQAMTLANLGREYDRLGRKQDALRCYEQALPIQRSVNDSSGEARTLEFIAHVYSDLGKLGLALENYQQALTIIQREVSGSALEARVLNSIGSVYGELGETQKALGFYFQALPVERTMGDQVEEGKTLTNIGLLYSSLQESQRALQYYNEALPIEHNGDDHSLEALILRCIGFVFQESGQKQKALEYYQSALKIQRDSGDRTREPRTLNYIGNVYNELGDEQNALNYYNQGLVAANAVGSIEQSAEVLYSLMSYWKARQNPALAIFFGKEAVNGYQQVRRNIAGLEEEDQESFLKSKAAYYHELAELLVQQDRLGEAERVLDLLKEEELNEVLRGAEVPGAKVAPLPLSSAEQKAQHDLATAEHAALPMIEMSAQYAVLQAKPAPTSAEKAQLKDLEGKIEAVNGQVSDLFEKTLYPELAQRVGTRAANALLNPEESYVSQLQSTLAELGPHVMGIRLLLGEQNAYAIIVTAQAREKFDLKATPDELRHKVLQVRDDLRNPKSDPKPKLAELYALVAGPFAAELSALERGADKGHVPTLLWSLDDTMRYLPMSALYDGSRYMAERFNDVLFTPESYGHMTALSADKGALRVLAMGLSKSYGGLPALPGVLPELDAVVHDPAEPGSHGPMDGVLLPDDRFTYDALKMELGAGTTFPVVHIASHFVQTYGNGEQPYLMLGGEATGQPDGYQLTLSKLANSPISFRGTHLLTLSACSTARGSTAENGLEMDSLGMVAQQKSAEAVLATLWDVNDASTSRIMSDFYMRWVQNPAAGKGEALRQAQLALLHSGQALQGSAAAAQPADYSHPFYWAPFVLIGNYR